MEAVLDPSTAAGDPGPDWSFARRPFWLFSHIFALAVVALFVALGFWQLSRHDQRQAANTAIEQRLDDPPLQVAAAADLTLPAEELDYRPAVVNATFVDADFVRVVNRSQGGVAGEYVTAIVSLADGSLLAVNRGFVPSNAEPELDPVPDGPVTIEGWLRQSEEKGRFSVDDSGQGTLIPRMNTDDLANRLGSELPAVWLQASGGQSGIATFPDPVPLPSLDDGPHLGYAAQWMVFALLGVLFYGALLWRTANHTDPTATDPAAISRKLPS